MGEVYEQNIIIQATQLNSGPILYPTIDLTLSVAVSLFKKPESISKLRSAQLIERMLMLECFEENKIALVLVRSFEDTCYKLYKGAVKDFVKVSICLSIWQNNTKR